MIQLTLLLLGPRYAARHLSKLLAFGAAWFAIGTFVVIDALDGALWFPLRTFGLLLLCEGLAAIVLAKSGLSLQTKFRYAKGAIGVLIGILVIVRHSYSDFLLAMLFGVGFALEGGLLIAAAWMVRYRNWRSTIVLGVMSIALAVVFFQPYPTHYRGTVPYCIGMWLAVSGCRMVWLYLRLRKSTVVQTSADPTDESETSPMIVHVWTPVGSSRGEAVRRPVIDRYIAAVDVHGVISTGHAALEAGGLYLSLYPAVEIDRSPDEFARLLRADASNDVRGRYLPSYPEEAASWCESTMKIAFRRYNPQRLQAFVAEYKATEIYNLTNRNCSSTVAEAIDVALEGTEFRRGDWADALRLMAMPEMWVAAQLRHRAHTMAWTPGLALDYARALRVVTDPPAVGWLALAALALRQSRRARDTRRV
ncbi:MFS transporter [Caballeronia sp. LjRoot34]|uniref:HdeD family acid-resistance protein n=1 Tax=Caballeronia sp. LjRoot34 TaxID=3342325 RepID=UPI003ECDF6FA